MNKEKLIEILPELKDIKEKLPKLKPEYHYQVNWTFSLHEWLGDGIKKMGLFIGIHSIKTDKNKFNDPDVYPLHNAKTDDGSQYVIDPKRFIIPKEYLKEE